MLKSLTQAIGGLAALMTASSVVVAGPDQTGSAYEFTFTAINGKPLPMKDLAGKVVLVVNTASLCGFTRQYEGLQALYTRFKDEGFVVVGVPSNNFGGQEPKSDNEIANFCKGAFGVTFPLTSKTDVVGPRAHPFYQWARATLGDEAAPRWNFHKYLIGSDGRLVSSFSTTVAPSDRKMDAAIREALKAVEDKAADASHGLGNAMRVQ